MQDYEEELMESQHEDYDDDPDRPDESCEL
jgi:hypothetical protein